MYQDAQLKSVTGNTISTVGVDIGDLILKREGGKQVVFHTWDFGGQVPRTAYCRLMLDV